MTTSPHETRVNQRSPTLPACPSVRLPARHAGNAAGCRSWRVDRIPSPGRPFFLQLEYAFQ